MRSSAVNRCLCGTSARKGAAGNPLADRPGCEPFRQLTADVEQSPVADAFRAGCLAGAAAQAAVKVVLDVAGEAAAWSDSRE